MATAGAVAARELRALRRIDRMSELISAQVGVIRDASKLPPGVGRDPRLAMVVRTERDADFLERLAAKLGVDLGEKPAPEAAELLEPTLVEIAQSPAPVVREHPDEFVPPDPGRLAGKAPVIDLEESGGVAVLVKPKRKKG